jgi:hypothetical protein
MPEDRKQLELINYIKYGRLNALVKLLRDKNLITDEDVKKIADAN